MLVAERLQRIVQIVNAQGSVRVSALSEVLQVTEETIRRDLDKLESEGKLLRSHGGAIRILDSIAEIPYAERESTNTTQKKAIAKLAIQHIAPNDRIMLDASSSAWHIARGLPDIPLTVVTNSIQVALELSMKSHIQVFSTGGLLRANSLSYVGWIAEQSLDQFHVDKVFFSCKGVHLDKGISESSESQAVIKQKMITCAEQVYLLADYSKFGQQSFIHLANWDAIHYVITDDLTSEALIESLIKRRVQVIR